MAEVHGWVGKLGTQEAIHRVVVADQLASSESDFARNPVVVNDLVQSLGVGQNNIDVDVFRMVGLQALLNCRDCVKVKDCAA